MATRVTAYESRRGKRALFLNSPGPILQIVPRVPGFHDGVGDYALQLARRLRADYHSETVFGSAVPTSAPPGMDFHVLAPLDTISETQCRERECADIILHYVNYGYQNRGVPMRLPPILRRLRGWCGGRFVTVFHELYASAPPWRSAFWLQPLQKSLAQDIARTSDACIVSSETMGNMLRQLAPDTSISVHPVISTVGEPAFSADQFVNRDPHKWVIFGGTYLVGRSLRSLASSIAAIPQSFVPRELFILGGKDNSMVRAKLDNLSGVRSRYLPEIEARAASQILSSCAFGWIDYFRQRNVPMGAILKSGSFASYCAHGVIPVLPQGGSPIAVRNDSLPGPYYINHQGSSFPLESELPKIAREIYEWYQRNASSGQLAKGIAAALAISSAALQELPRA